MKAVLRLACALLTTWVVTGGFAVLLNQWLSLVRLVKEAFERLEPDAVKVCAVSRTELIVN